MPVQTYGLQYTMYKAENSQMFQNQYIIQDRGGREHTSRRLQNQNDQKMEQVQEGEELNNEDAGRIETEAQGGGGGTQVPIRSEQEADESDESSDDDANNSFEQRGDRLDIRV